MGGPCAYLTAITLRVWLEKHRPEQSRRDRKLGSTATNKNPEPSMHSTLLSLLPRLKFFWLGGGGCRGDGALPSRSFLALSP
jgi:hypothetical protein